jgi:hypothetical protein
MRNAKVSFGECKTKMPDISFTAINWDGIPETEHTGESGTAKWRTVEFPGLRIRLVRYSKGYRADHWCRLGHIVHCLAGEVLSELRDGRTFRLTKGMTYVVSDDISEHRSTTETGVDLLIIDGDFLRSNG